MYTPQNNNNRIRETTLHALQKEFSANARPMACLITKNRKCQTKNDAQTALSLN